MRVIYRPGLVGTCGGPRAGGHLESPGLSAHHVTHSEERRRRLERLPRCLRRERQARVGPGRSRIEGHLTEAQAGVEQIERLLLWTGARPDQHASSQGKASQGTSRHVNTIQGKARQGNARQGKARHVKAGQGTCSTGARPTRRISPCSASRPVDCISRLFCRSCGISVRVWARVCGER